MAIRILVYDDNKGRQEALKLLIETAGDMEFAGSKENCMTVEEDISWAKPDVVLMDIDMPGANGIEGLRRIRKADPSIYIIMQTVFEDEEKIFSAIHEGANGYFLKKTAPGKLIEGIREVLEGGAPMTPWWPDGYWECSGNKSPKNQIPIPLTLLPEKKRYCRCLHAA